LSSILRALKKIEEDTQPSQTYPSLTNLTVSKQVFNSNTRKRRRLRRLLYLLLILLLTAVGTIILFDQRRLIITKNYALVSSETPQGRDGSNSDQAKVYRGKVPSLSAKPAQKPPMLTRPPKKRLEKAVSGSANTQNQAGAEPGGRRLVDARQPPQAAPDTPRPKMALNSKVIKPQANVSAPPATPPPVRPGSQKDDRSVAASTLAEPSSRTRPPVTYDRIDDSKLKLQALAWSDDAARRMAVINGSIVHEGESVDGYQVVNIREEDVIVNEGGKSWRLEFGLQH